MEALIAAALTASPSAQDRSLASGTSGTSMRLDLVCDAVREAWDRPLTLTEMEQIAGLSARSLQYAFRTRFGCSPMQWQRHERMLFARQRVINSTPAESLTQIALSLGFSSLAAFSALYRQHFGESPSQTLARR